MQLLLSSPKLHLCLSRRDGEGPEVGYLSAAQVFVSLARYYTNTVLTVYSLIKNNES